MKAIREAAWVTAWAVMVLNGKSDAAVGAFVMALLHALFDDYKAPSRDHH